MLSRTQTTWQCLAKASNEGTYSSGGHFQLNYNATVTHTGEEAWKIPQQENYAEYQAKREAEELQRQRAAAGRCQYYTQKKLFGSCRLLR